MSERSSIGVRPEHIRYAVGYACTNAWGIMMLYVPWTGSLAFSLQALLSMVPGLATCLGCLFFFRRRLALAGRTPVVAAAAFCTSLGTLACTYPALAHLPGAFVAGMVLSGAFAIILIMAWFDTYASIGPRGIIVLSGGSILVAALESWVLIQCDGAVASVLVSLLPMLSFVLLPLPTSPQAPAARGDEAPGLRDVLQEAVPLRTLAGFAITFFVLSSITTVAVGHETAPSLSFASLLIPLAATAFFVASGLFAREKIDPSILYKVLLVASAAFVFFSFYLGYGNGGLSLHAHNVIEVMAWVVLALGAKKTPVAPPLVFAMGWLAECAGKTLGQLTAPLLAGEPLAFMAVVVMLVLLGVGFAFSEGYHLLDVDEGEEGGAASAPQRSVSVCGSASGKGVSGLSGGGAENGTAEDGSRACAEPTCVGADAAENPDPYGAFCAEYDLSPRESEVFRLWVTGHGLRYIQNALFVSESTVKSHLRSIYRKCDTHNRDEIIALFERETM